MIGLYVDVWREGLKNLSQTEQLLSFCSEAGITDLFVHMHTDIVSISIEWDYLKYITENKNGMKIHAWVSGLQLGRINSWSSSVYSELPTLNSCGVLYLDAKNKKGQDFLINKINGIIDNYDIDGIHLDKFRMSPAYVKTISDKDKQDIKKGLNRVAKSINKHGDLELSCVIRNNFIFTNDDLSPWKELKKDKYFDWISVVVLSKNGNMHRYELNRTFDYEISKIDQKEAKAISLGCFNDSLYNTENKSVLASNLGFGILYFSYGAYSSESQETRQQFKEMIINAKS